MIYYTVFTCVAVKQPLCNCNYMLARWIGDNEDHHNHNHHKHPTHNIKQHGVLGNYMKIPLNNTRGFPISIQASCEINYIKTVFLADIWKTARIGSPNKQPNKYFWKPVENHNKCPARFKSSNLVARSATSWHPASACGVCELGDSNSAW